MALLFLFTAACSSSRQAPGPSGPGTSKPYSVNGVRYVPAFDPDYDKVGAASWYGGRFHGRRTASGQRYDMNAMTAAHTTLPMGSKVKVTNLGNRRTVRLTINDRGPFVRGRIIDVSRRAADELGFRLAGTAEVRVQVITNAQPKDRVQSAQTVNQAPDSVYFLPVLGRAMEHGTRLGEFFWKNPDQQRRGSIMPLTQPRESARPFCRNYRRTAEKGTEETVFIGRACRSEDGSWRILRERERG